MRMKIVSRDFEQRGKPLELIVSRIALDTLEGFKMTYPETSAERRKELLSIRQQLAR